MSHPKHLSAVAALLAAAVSALIPPPARGQAIVAGRLAAKIDCLADPACSYALYLPSSFDPRKTWPVLVLFDPGARGAGAIEVFRAAAERYGWILAASNDSRNGPMEPSVRAARALWTDVRQRVPIDENRIYASGFSGGSRVASVFPAVAGRPIAGIIGCGAGLLAGIEPGKLGAAAYFGLAGLRDFNYGEMKGLDRALDPSGIPHRFHYFDGPHAWPDPASCARAVGWMEITAMKQGLRPPDRERAAAFVRGELEEAGTLEAAGRVFWAADRLEAAMLLAAGMGLDIAGLADLPARLERLKAGRDYGLFLEAERKRDRKDAEFRKEFSRAVGAIEDVETGGSPAVPNVLRETGVRFLKKAAKGKGTIEDRSSASRRLFDLCLAARTRAMELYAKGDMIRSGAYLDLAIAACEEGLSMESRLYYDRSCVAARAGDKALALRHLAAAVDKGFANLEVLETDKDLDPIRPTAAFQALLERVRRSRGL